MERGQDASLHFPFLVPFNWLPCTHAGKSLEDNCLQLFRLVAVEYLMGKGLTGGGSRRYLWALFVVCMDLARRMDWLSGWPSKLESTGYGN
jgi:hypothetical protein